MPDVDKTNAYVSWTTFKNAIDGFGSGLPNRVDRSVFPGLAGGVQYQLIAALRFFGLIEDDYKPSPALRRLAVPEEEERKKQLGVLFQEHYPLDLDLTKTTPAELDERMTAITGLTGSTRKKAVRFFLAGAKYLDIPVSPLLAKKQPTNGGAARKPRRGRNKAKAGADAALQAGPFVSAATGTAKSIKLKRDEVVTLHATADFFAMDPEDRDFLFGIVKQLEEHERKLSAAPSGQSQTDAGREE